MAYDVTDELRAAVAQRANGRSEYCLIANQLRLYFSAMAYLLVDGLRRLALSGTDMAQAQPQTIRLRLLKIGAQIRITVRKIWISMATSYPHQQLFQRAWASIRC